MPIRFHCEACEARVKVPAGSEGRKVKCPRCGHLQRVPRHSEQLVAVGSGSGSSDPSGDSAAGDSGSFEAQAPKGGIEAGDSLTDIARTIDKDLSPPVEPSYHQRVVERKLKQEQEEESQAGQQEEQATAQEQAEAQDHLSQVQEESTSESEPMPQVESRATAPLPPVPEKAVAPAIVAAAPAPPRPIVLNAKAAAHVPKAAAPDDTDHTDRDEPAESSRMLRPARHVKPYNALKNLATALRITPAVLIPAVLWHVLQTTTISGAIVALIGGAAIVAMTWTLAEIADAVRDLARRV